MRVKCCVSIGAVLLSTSVAAAEKSPPIPAPPLPDNYQQIAQDSIKPTLREPESGRFEFREPPYQMTCKKGVFHNPTPVNIWMIDVWVNAKNGFGGYTGFQPMSVVIREQDGALLQQPYTKPSGGAITRFGLCKRAAVG